VYLSLATFPNPAGLTRDGGNMWSTSQSSGTPPTIGSPGQNNLGNTVAGELEQSNVDLATEFTNMITAQRGFQANSRVITTADQMLQTIVQMGQ
jgi:flagellar hook protein FlgE